MLATLIIWIKIHEIPFIYSPLYLDLALGASVNSRALFTIREAVIRIRGVTETNAGYNIKPASNWKPSIVSDPATVIARKESNIHHNASGDTRKPPAYVLKPNGRYMPSPTPPSSMSTAVNPSNYGPYHTFPYPYDDDAVMVIAPESDSHESDENVIPLEEIKPSVHSSEKWDEENPKPSQI